MRNLSGKRALVTGAASGIGRAIALRLAGEGMHLLLADVDGAGLEATAYAAESHGVEVDWRCVDVADRPQLDHLADDAIDRWAGVDLLVNNAGVSYHGFTHHMPSEEWDRIIAVNLNAPLRLTCRLLPALLARPRAHVLNVCSVLGLVGMPRVAAYSTSKFGLVGFSESLRAEYGRWGLGVTALCPGLVRTKLFSSARPETAGQSPKQPPRWLCTTPERIAKSAVRGIRRNRPRVVVEPIAQMLFGLKQNVPSLLDWVLRWGEHRHVRQREQHLEQVATNLEDGYRWCIDYEEQRRAQKNPDESEVGHDEPSPPRLRVAA
ncbi:MAG: SDR family oxidoreductase [Planctomycetota bacterium]